MEMAVEDPGHAPRRIGMQMHMRGAQRRIDFLYPGDMKGTRVLNLTDTQSYVYLPAFRKVRRIASHVREQSMFGSDYSLADFASLALGKHYQGRIVAEDAEHWTLCALPRAAASADSGAGDDGERGGRLEIVVRKDLGVPTELRFFAVDGQHLRTETRDDYFCEKDACAPRRTKMVDHRHGDHWTEVTIKDMVLNSQFSPDIFSLRALQRRD